MNALNTQIVALAVAPSCIIGRKALLAAMVTLCSTIEARNTIPILSNVLIESVGPNQIKITGTDLDIESVVRVDANCDELSFTLPAFQLRDMLKKSTAESVMLTDELATSFEWVDEVQNGEDIKVKRWQGGRVKVEFDNGASATLQSLPSHDFPDLATGEFTRSFSVLASEIAKGFAGVAVSISTEETRYYLNGIYLHHSSGDLHGISGLVATATDGHRLSHRSIPALVPTDMPGVIVPRKTVLNMIKLLGKKAAGSIKIELSAAKIRFSHGDYVITSKLIDGTFPDYARVVPRNNSHCVSLNREAFAAMAAQVATGATKYNRAVIFEFEGGKVTASFTTPDVGTSSASMACTANKADFEITIGFNSKYVTDLCAAMTGQTIDLLIEDAGSPMVITCPDDPRGLHVLMPMRA